MTLKQLYDQLYKAKENLKGHGTAYIAAVTEILDNFIIWDNYKEIEIKDIIEFLDKVTPKEATGWFGSSDDIIINDTEYEKFLQDPKNPLKSKPSRDDGKKIYDKYKEYKYSKLKDFKESDEKKYNAAKEKLLKEISILESKHQSELKKTKGEELFKLDKDYMDSKTAKKDLETKIKTSLSALETAVSDIPSTTTSSSLFSKSDKDPSEIWPKIVDVKKYLSEKRKIYNNFINEVQTKSFMLSKIDLRKEYDSIIRDVQLKDKLEFNSKASNFLEKINKTIKEETGKIKELEDKLKDKKTTPEERKKIKEQLSLSKEDKEKITKELELKKLDIESKVINNEKIANGIEKSIKDKEDKIKKIEMAKETKTNEYKLKLEELKTEFETIKVNKINETVNEEIQKKKQEIESKLTNPNLSEEDKKNLQDELNKAKFSNIILYSNIKNTAEKSANDEVERLLSEKKKELDNKHYKEIEEYEKQKQRIIEQKTQLVNQEKELTKENEQVFNDQKTQLFLYEQIKEKTWLQKLLANRNAMILIVILVIVAFIIAAVTWIFFIFLALLLNYSYQNRYIKDAKAVGVTVDFSYWALLSRGALGPVYVLYWLVKFGFRFAPPPGIYIQTKVEKAVSENKSEVASVSSS